MIKKLFGLYRARLYKNAFYLVLNSGVMGLFGFLFWTLNARLFSSHEVGLALTIISAMTLITTISLLGFDDSIIRYLGKSENKSRKINSIYCLCGILSGFVAIIFVVFVNIFAPKLSILKSNPIFGFLFVIFTIAWSIFILSDGIFTAYRETKFIFVKSVIFSVLKLIFPFLLISFGSFGVFSSWTLAAILSLSFVFIILLKRFNFKPKPIIDFSMIGKMFSFTFSNYLLRLLLSTPVLLLPLIITNFLSATDTAYFYMAWVISDFISVIPTSISTSLFAEASFDSSDVKNDVKKAIKIGYSFLIPILLIILLFGGLILKVFGSDYSINSTNLLRLLALAAIPFTLNTIYITVIKIKKNLKKLIYIGVYFFFVFLGSSLVLLNKYGIVGIGISWLATNLVFTVYVIKCYLKNEL